MSLAAAVRRREVAARHDQADDDEDDLHDEARERVQHAGARGDRDLQALLLEEPDHERGRGDRAADETGEVVGELLADDRPCTAAAPRPRPSSRSACGNGGANDSMNATATQPHCGVVEGRRPVDVGELADQQVDAEDRARREQRCRSGCTRRSGSGSRQLRAGERRRPCRGAPAGAASACRRDRDASRSTAPPVRASAARRRGRRGPSARCAAASARSSPTRAAVVARSCTASSRLRSGGAPEEARARSRRTPSCRRRGATRSRHGGRRARCGLRAAARRCATRRPAWRR